MKTHQPQTKESNPRAISIRIKPLAFGRITGQRNHDLRLGRQPKYVDLTRQNLNETIISPMSAPDLKKICVDRRQERETKRQIKKNASIATCGIITFGTDAQVKFEALDLATQAAAMRAVAEAIAESLQTTLTGLVIHRDETATHGHFQLPAVNVHGHPLSQANSLSDISRLQDVAADTIARFEPAIERGHKKRDRLAAGASYSDTVHRSVKELHRDLPLELEKKRLRVAEMEARVTALETKSDRTAAENKRLEAYKKRHLDRIAELQLVEAAAKAAAEAAMASEKQKILDKANEDADKITKAALDRAEALVESVGMYLTGQVLPIVEHSKLSWKPRAALEGAAYDRFKLSLKWFTPIYERFQPVLNTLLQQLTRARDLVSDLEQFRDEMSQQQRARLDQAKTELDDPSP